MGDFVGWNQGADNRVLREHNPDVPFHKRAHVDHEGKACKSHFAEKPCY